MRREGSHVLVETSSRQTVGTGSLPWNRGIAGVFRGPPDRSLNACASSSVRVRPRSGVLLPRRFGGDCPCGRRPVSPLQRRRCTAMPTVAPRTWEHRETLHRNRARQIPFARGANAGARLDTRWSSHPAVARFYVRRIGRGYMATWRRLREGARSPADNRLARTSRLRGKLHLPAHAPFVGWESRRRFGDALLSVAYLGGWEGLSVRFSGLPMLPLDGAEETLITEHDWRFTSSKCRWNGIETPRMRV